MRRVINLAGLALALNSLLRAGQWPQYRGPAGAGVSEGTAPVQFGLKQNLQWKAEVPLGHSSPSMWGDRIFLTSFESASKKLRVRAYERRTGKLLWQRVVPAQKIEEVHPVSSPATATPVVDGERVYVYFGSAGVFSYDLQGNSIWSRPLPAAKLDFGSGTSPILTEHALVIALDHGERRMLALAPGLEMFSGI
jgi:outer membrane protein assembly factor BamB